MTENTFRPFQNALQGVGDGTAEDLMIASKQTRKWTRDELEKLYHHYKRKVDELRSTKGL